MKFKIYIIILFRHFLFNITGKIGYGIKLSQSLYQLHQFDKAKKILDIIYAKNTNLTMPLTILGKIGNQKLESLSAVKKFNGIDTSIQDINTRHKARIENCFYSDLMRMISYHISRNFPIRPNSNHDNIDLEWYPFIKCLEEKLNGMNWHNDSDLAKLAHFMYSPDLKTAIQTFDQYLIEKSVEMGYLTWPKKIQKYIMGRSVIDVGCGFGAFGNAFLAAGAASYTGIDPEMNLNSKETKNIRNRTLSEIEFSPNEIQKMYPQINLIQSNFENIANNKKFDIVSLHNVTEHLLHIENVFSGLLKMIHKDSYIIFNHHNYYCWNGHHQQPHDLEEYKPNNSAHQLFADYKHVTNIDKIPKDNYIFTNLNRITLKELRYLVEKKYKIIEWNEKFQPESWTHRLNKKIINKALDLNPSLTENDLKIRAVFCVVKTKNEYKVIL